MGAPEELFAFESLRDHSWGIDHHLHSSRKPSAAFCELFVTISRAVNVYLHYQDHLDSYQGNESGQVLDENWGEERAPVMSTRLASFTNCR